MAENLARRRYKVDWAHLAFLLIIGCATLWYLCDAISVSTSVDNLLLVAPLSVVALALVGTLAIQCVSLNGKTTRYKPKDGGTKDMGASELRSNDVRSLTRIGSVAAALGAYVFLLNVIGFDVSTWIFVTIVMLICGERRPLALIIYPLAVAVILIGGFRLMLPFPMHTLIL
jgi:hypothetical protein